MSPATNGYTTCATHFGGTIYGWGQNVHGELGDGTTDDRFTPKKIGTSTSWKSVSPGSDRTCAIHSSGAAYCWGLDTG